jgi:hypothetical protein
VSVVAMAILTIEKIMTMMMTFQADYYINKARRKAPRFDCLLFIGFPYPSGRVSCGFIYIIYFPIMYDSESTTLFLPGECSVTTRILRVYLITYLFVEYQAWR